MYLKSIELQGFKSFPDKTTLSFNEGITVIIGPNGSGKSNIADAMRWVLGEVSSRSIRGTKMEDVIFGGCESRKPGSFAQVTLCLDNSSPEGRLNIEYDTVTVTRRYFRGGDSDYLINGKMCRLKDIHKLFMNTGIGRDGYSVIGQGKIAEIVSRKSEERRSVFEEAAGISKYKFSKNESAKKLAVTEDNLARVLDILNELEQRVGPLEKEAEKAKKYLVLHGEKKELDIALWLYDMALLTEEIKKLRGSYELYKTELELASTELASLEEKTESIMKKTCENKRLQDIEGEKITALTEKKFQRSGDASVALKELEHIKADTSAAEEIYRAAVSDSQELAQRISEKEQAVREAEEKGVQLSAQRALLAARYEEITRQLEERSAEADECQKKIQDLKDEITDIRIKLSVSDTGDGEDEARAIGLDSEIAQKRQSLEMIQERAERSEKVIKDYEEKYSEAAGEAKAQRELSAQCASKAQALRDRINDIYIDISSKKHRVDNLRRMEELLEGYSHSVRFVVEEYSKGNIKSSDGGMCGEIYGPVSRLIKVEGKYTTAIETALGAAMQNIVVKDDAAAKAAIRYLQKNGAGRATFYPVSTIKPMFLQYTEQELSKNDGYIAVASSLASCDEKFSGVIGNLLGRTVVFENMDKASVFAKKYGYKIRIVTLDGQLINAGGSYTGGSARTDSGMLSRNTQIDTLTKQIQEGKKKQQELQSELDSVLAQQQKYELNAQNAENSSSIITSLMNAENTQLQVLLAQISTDRSRLHELEDEKKDISARGERRLKEKEENSARLLVLSKELDEKTAHLASVEQQIQDGNASQEEYRKSISSSDISIAENAKVLQLEAGVLKELTERAFSAGQRAKEAQERIAFLKKSYEDHTELALRSGKEAKQLDAQIEKSRSVLADLSSQALQLESALNASRNAEKEKAHKKELMFREYTSYESRLLNAEEKREKLSTVLLEDHELTYSQAKEIPLSIQITHENRAENAKHQAELKNKIRALGHVNVNAPEEYKSVKERYDFMTVQTEDLKKAKTELEEIIYKLDEEMKQAFTEAITEINTCFGRVFARLFGGGTAEIRLAEPDNVLESGIDINVAPPGKIIKSLSLLSGGEQSFVAIALYFALLEVNPTPFILLDEIEAALDEVNVDRFADYLTENKKKTQFILISHRRGTMESADRLYGVTMPTKGISKILSVDVDEIEQKIGKLD